MTSFLFPDYGRGAKGRRKTYLHCVLVIVRDITANEFVISGDLVGVSSDRCKVRRARGLSRHRKEYELQFDEDGSARKFRSFWFCTREISISDPLTSTVDRIEKSGIYISLRLRNHIVAREFSFMSLKWLCEKYVTNNKCKSFVS